LVLFEISAKFSLAWMNNTTRLADNNN